MSSKEHSETATAKPRKRRWFKLPFAFRRFAREDEGVTAIEFAMLAGPFFALFFAIIETSLTFFAGQLLESAIDDVGRKIRTGQLDNTMTQEEFRTEICDSASLLFDCSGILVKLEVASDFGALGGIPQPDEDGEYDPDDFSFAAPDKLEIAQITAMYVWPVFVNYFELLKNGVASDGVKSSQSPLAAGYTVLTAISVFRTEP